MFSYFCVLLLISLFHPHDIQDGFSHLGDTEETL